MMVGQGSLGHKNVATRAVFCEPQIEIYGVTMGKIFEVPGWSLENPDCNICWISLSQIWWLIPS